MKPRSIASCIALGSVLALTAPLIAVQDHEAPAQKAQNAVRHSPPRQNHDAEDEGQRVFEQNCARCHNAPDGFSPRITGTIVRHMRVRANLSRHDEKVLLHFFNP